MSNLQLAGPIFYDCASAPAASLRQNLAALTDEARLWGGFSHYAGSGGRGGELDWFAPREQR
eukprot:SAG31_NODE_2748_length_5147_cov_2.564184_6_plen_62_part_00